MADVEIKETVATKLAKIDENLKNLTLCNTNDHLGLSSQIKDLCTYVNHQNKLMQDAIKSLEETRIKNIAVKEGEEEAADKIIQDDKVDKIRANKSTQNKLIAVIGAVVTGVITILAWLKANGAF